MVEAMQQFRADPAALNDGRGLKRKDDVDKAAEPATADSIGWDAMPIEQREAIAVCAGWSAGGQSHHGNGAAHCSACMAEHPDHTRGTLIRLQKWKPQKEEASPPSLSPPASSTNTPPPWTNCATARCPSKNSKAAFALVRDNAPPSRKN